nr:RNA-directed DNA polymerase, eukaryota, reverse transcriptase zinc-binding domain protein [Tanacetum cinerariifolium]
MDKDRGGLGVASLYALNRGLLIKWFWKFFNQKSSLWAKVIKAIHGEDGGVDSMNISGVRTCWKSVINEIKSLKSQGVNVTDFMRLKLGNGNTMYFWNDNWHGDGAFKDLFSRLYALENSKEVKDKWSWSLESSGEFLVAFIQRVINEKRI